MAEFPDEDGGKPTVMRYIIRDQAGMAEYWEGEWFYGNDPKLALPFIENDLVENYSKQVKR